MAKLNCKNCEKYKRKGHNFCKMCGYEFRPHSMRRKRVSIADHFLEKFCGYCGGKIHSCDCKQ